MSAYHLCTEWCVMNTAFSQMRLKYFTKKVSPGIILLISLATAFVHIVCIKTWLTVILTVCHLLIICRQSMECFPLSKGRNNLLRSIQIQSARTENVPVCRSGRRKKSFCRQLDFRPMFTSTSKPKQVKHCSYCVIMVKLLQMWM